MEVKSEWEEELYTRHLEMLKMPTFLCEHIIAMAEVDGLEAAGHALPPIWSLHRRAKHNICTLRL